MSSLPPYLDLEGAQQTPLEEARAVLLPLPYERTTSYGEGTAGGPEALLAASSHVELYDEELGTEPFRIGIATAPACRPEAGSLADALAEVEAAARRYLRAGRLLVAIGGEHGLTPPLVRATRDVHGEIGVVQFDAHADLRETYAGSPHSHACAMRRLHELDIPVLAVGIRSLSRAEASFVAERRLPVIWGRELAGAASRFERELDALPDRVYLSFDVDYFDPSLLPATGTPEPGGGLWHETLDLLRRLFRRKQVVGMDLVELAPIAGLPASDFVAARLVYKCIGYWAAPGPPPPPVRLVGPPPALG